MISIEEMKALEDNSGVSKIELMENAGLALAQQIVEKGVEGKRVLVACYHGNNGGDGFVAARHLSDKCEVEVLFIGEEANLKAEARAAFNSINDNHLIQFTTLEFIDFNDYDIIIDALLGTGIVGELGSRIQSTIKAINDSKAFKISVDVPSGMNPDTGEIEDISVNADMIVTFHDIKKGMSSLKEKIKIVDIGIKT